jgi:hypothetical protein
LNGPRESCVLKWEMVLDLSRFALDFHADYQLIL